MTHLSIWSVVGGWSQSQLTLSKRQAALCKYTVAYGTVMLITQNKYDICFKYVSFWQS